MWNLSEWMSSFHESSFETGTFIGTRSHIHAPKRQKQYHYGKYLFTPSVKILTPRLFQLLSLLTLNDRRHEIQEPSDVTFTQKALKTFLLDVGVEIICHLKTSSAMLFQGLSPHLATTGCTFTSTLRGWVVSLKRTRPSPRLVNHENAFLTCFRHFFWEVEKIFRWRKIKV